MNWAIFNTAPKVSKYVGTGEQVTELYNRLLCHVKVQSFNAVPFERNVDGADRIVADSVVCYGNI